MKKLIIAFILGILFCNGIIYGVNLYKSEDIQYTPTDNSWEVDNVNEAINSLYGIQQELDNIKNLGDAIASDIASGKTAVVKGKLVNGTGKNQSNFKIIMNITVGSGMSGKLDKGFSSTNDIEYIIEYKDGKLIYSNDYNYSPWDSAAGSWYWGGFKVNSISIELTE